MATLMDLTDGFNSLSESERFELIREIRGLRRIPTKKPSEAKRISSPRGKKKPKDLLSKLSPEQAQQLLEMLGD